MINYEKISIGMMVMIRRQEISLMCAQILKAHPSNVKLFTRPETQVFFPFSLLKLMQ